MGLASHSRVNTSYITGRSSKIKSKLTICIGYLDTSGYRCECPPEYYGQTCQNRVDYCHLYFPCGPYGTCTNNLIGLNFTCTCLPGFTGARY